MKTCIDHEGFVRSINNESPRTRIILQAGLLEELLRAGIKSQLPDNKSSSELFGEGSGLGLTALAKYAHAFGLIGARELHDTKQFANIRNDLAHHWDSSFTKQSVQKAADKIRIVKLRTMTAPEPHQTAFSKADYFGIYFIETLANRWNSFTNDGGLPTEFLKSIEVDIEARAKTVKFGRDN